MSLCSYVFLQSGYNGNRSRYIRIISLTGKTENTRDQMTTMPKQDWFSHTLTTVSELCKTDIRIYVVVGITIKFRVYSISNNCRQTKAPAEQNHILLNINVCINISHNFRGRYICKTKHVCSRYMKVICSVIRRQYVRQHIYWKVDGDICIYDGRQRHRYLCMSVNMRII